MKETEEQVAAADDRFFAALIAKEREGKTPEQIRKEAEASLARWREAHGKSTDAPSGRDVALSFLKATVEDVNKPMAERMEAARTLLEHPDK